MTQPSGPWTNATKTHLPSAHAQLRTELRESCRRWGRFKQNEPFEQITGESRARAALAVIDEALDLLGNRNRAGTRAWLDQKRGAIQSALDAFISVSGTLDPEVDRHVEMLGGPAALDLIERITRYEAELKAANLAVEMAPRDEVLARRDLRELLGADQRSIVRDIAALKAALKFPELIDLSALSDARTSTEALARQPAKKPSAAQMHAALDQGRDVKPDTARLWVIFEPASEHVLLDLRWRRFSGQ